MCTHARARARFFGMLVVLGQKKQKKKIASLEALQRVTHGVAHREDSVGVDMHVHHAYNCTYGCIQVLCMHSGNNAGGWRRLRIT